MAIKGLTDRGAAFPQIGILRKGDAKPNENRIGKDLTYFRFTSDDAATVEAFQRIHGKEPDTINVILPYRTADENFSAWREDWVAGGLKHRCDGETVVLWLDDKGKYQTTPKKCTGGCKPVGRLSVIIPEFKRFAFVTVLTTSLHDIMTLSENLAALEMIRGDLRGIPLILRRRPRKVSTPQIYPKGHPKQYQPTGKRVRMEKWLLTLEAAPQWVRLQLAASEAAALPQLPAGTLPELEAPEDNNGVTVDERTGEILDTTAQGIGAPPDFEDADWHPIDEPPPTEQPTQTTQPGSNGQGNGNQAKIARPYSADLVRGYVRQKSKVWTRNDNIDPARDYSGAAYDDQKAQPPADADVQRLAAVMGAAMGDCDDTERAARRHAVLEYVTGRDSTSSLSAQEVSTWLELWAKGNTFEPNDHAASEAARVFMAWQQAKGQIELPVGADNA